MRESERSFIQCTDWTGALDLKKKSDSKTSLLPTKGHHLLPLFDYRKQSFLTHPPTIIYHKLKDELLLLAPSNVFNC